LLLILVIGVWGTVGYKIIKGIQPELPPANNFNSFNNLNNITEIQKDSFKINPPTRDPFLDPASKTIKIEAPIKKAVQSNLTWPNISYNGSIINAQNRQQLFIVNVNQEQFLVQKGQELLELKIIAGNEQKIQISYKGQRKWFPIQQP
jgi:hypothetical protein